MKRINWLNIIFSFILSLSINYKLVINRGLNYFINDFHLNYKFIINNIILSIIIYFILLIVFKILDNIKIKDKLFVIDKQKKLVIFFLIFISTFIFLLTYYPGVYLNDTYYMIYSPISSSNGHPLFYSLFISILFFTFKIYFSSSFSIFCLSLLQSIFSSIILTYIVCWFNKKIKNKTLTLLLIIYFVFMPIVSNYNMALNKDGPYSLMFLLFLTLYYEIIDSKGSILLNKKFMFKLIIISLLMTYIRNNGVYVIFLTMISTLFVLGKKYIKNIICFLLILLCLSYIPTFISKSNGVKYLKREKYGIPIQQISYLVKYRPDSLNESDYELLDKIIINSKDTINNKYNVYKVDNIKFDSNFDDDQFNKYEKEFFLLWLNKLPSNFNSYVKSYLLNNYHLWAIDKLEKKQSIFTELSISGVKEEHQINNRRVLPKNIHNFLINYYEVFNTYLNPALCFIILLLFNIYSLNKNKKMFYFSIPLIITWLILMIASPLSSALRYMAIYIYALPIIIFFILKETRYKYE